MNELQLVGYTADLKFLVFSDVADGARYKVPVDDDIVATLSEVLQLIDPDRDPFRRAPAEPEPPQWPQEWPQPERAQPARPAPAEEPKRNGRRKGPKPGEGALAAFAVLAERRQPGKGGKAAETPAPVPEPEVRSSSKLSPRQIQALLRSGLTSRQVAKRADTDEAWVAKWLAPIEAERRLVLEAVEQARVTKSRLGPSRDLLGEAVRKNLAEKGLGGEDGDVEWSAARREGDPHWVVTLRYRSRGRNQRAIWHFNPDTGELEPRNSLAVDVAWTRPRGGRRATVAPTGRGGAKRSVTKKKPTAKKTGAKQPAAKKPAAKKPAAKRPAAKKAAAKKPAVKKAPAKRPAAKKAAAKKAPAKRVAAQKVTAQKVTAKKAAPARSR